MRIPLLIATMTTGLTAVAVNARLRGSEPGLTDVAYKFIELDWDQQLLDQVTREDHLIPPIFTAGEKLTLLELSRRPIEQFRQEMRPAVLRFITHLYQELQGTDYVEGWTDDTLVEGMNKTTTELYDTLNRIFNNGHRNTQ
jgi:hypothetical protein